MGIGAAIWGIVIAAIAGLLGIGGRQLFKAGKAQGKQEGREENAQLDLFESERPNLDRSIDRLRERSRDGSRTRPE